MSDAFETKVKVNFHHVMTYLEKTAESQGITLPGESDSLFDQRVLDSFGLLEFIAFLEETFAIKIPDDDLTPDRFETIENIREYLENHVRH